jgi:uncharacterized protein (TIGR02147 family)
MGMTVFEFTDYKAFLKALFKQLPKQGRGQARKLAEHLSVHSVVISQVMKGDRHFTPEQALAIASFYGLDTRATEFLVTLVNRARAGTQDLVRHYDKRLAQLAQENSLLKNKIVEHKTLSDTDKALFYSNWFYSGIRLLTSIKDFDNIDAICAHFGLGRPMVAEILEFLVSRGLCVEKNGRYEMAVSATYVGSADKYVNNHRRNWRLKALEKLTDPSEHALFYSSPCTLSRKDLIRVREEITKLIEGFSKRVADSPSEHIACLNIDWFEF